MKNIIFLTHSEKKPSGGAKYIYRYSQIINEIKNFSSEVIHIKKKKSSKLRDSINKKLNFKRGVHSGWQFEDITYSRNFKYKWFDNKINIKQNFYFNKKKDFVILPEIFAHIADDLLIKNKINYAILVQNGYVINSTNNEKKLFKAYKNAKFILSSSGDTTECIKLKFPKLKLKILKVSYCIKFGEINFRSKKNIITYSSRKLPQHSNLVISYLKPHLPTKWSLKNLHNLSNREFTSSIKKSKIFLSFSYLEGLGLPPVEAALTGNQVIGYTGEGGNEYWEKPLFTKINFGQINQFVKTIIKRTNKDELKKNYSKKKINKLKKKFSALSEIKSINKFLKLI
tara:strand:+ start:9 stop:1031 length:1023 start_codon:yes stop_codon:yes gene_type:complete